MKGRFYKLFTLQNKKIKGINLFSFILLTLVIAANAFFSIKHFRIIEQLDKIQINLPLFTGSFVIVFLSFIQWIGSITIVFLETLLVTFIINTFIDDRLKLSGFFSITVFANILSVLLNMSIVFIGNFEQLQDLQWLNWFPGSEFLLASLIFLYLAKLGDLISAKLKIKICVSIFLITYGLTCITQLLITTLS